MRAANLAYMYIFMYICIYMYVYIYIYIYCGDSRGGRCRFRDWDRNWVLLQLQELQRLNESLEHHIASRTAEAERKAQYLEQFAYVTSHDLKAPLRAVANLAQWIEEDLDDRLDDSSREPAFHLHPQLGL